jgi:3-oxosteroid 1-dehydrogenase
MAVTAGVERSYDWISIGSGAAGLSGALAAARRSGSALVVEKSERFGGNTAYSYGSLWAAANPLQAEAGQADSAADGERYLRWLAAGFADEARLACLARESGAALEELRRSGVPLRIIGGLPDHYHPVAPGTLPVGRCIEVVPVLRSELGELALRLEESPYLPPGVSWSDAIAWGGFGRRYAWDEAAVASRAGLFAAGQGLAARLLLRCHQEGVALLPSAALESLEVAGGRVIGVRLRTAGGPLSVEARRGVLLATGGYESNPALVTAYEPFPQSPSHFTPSITGDGMVAAQEIGAGVAVISTRLFGMLGYWAVEPSGHRRFREAGIHELTAPHTLVVNRAGRRFADESFFQDVMARLADFDVYTHAYRNLPCYLIFDAQFPERHAFAGAPPGSPVPDWVPRAGDLPGLAARLGVDGEALQATVDDFNHWARQGNDPRFNRGTLHWTRVSNGDVSRAGGANLGTVERPPFYGLEMYPSVTGAAGLLADPWGRVMHVRGRPIPGLYGAGHVCAPTESGTGYQAGLTLMSGVLFAQRAVHAAWSVDTA